MQENHHWPERWCGLARCVYIEPVPPSIKIGVGGGHVRHIGGAVASPGHGQLLPARGPQEKQ